LIRSNLSRAQDPCFDLHQTQDRPTASFSIDPRFRSSAKSAPTPLGPQPKRISPFPEPLFEAAGEPASFQDALTCAGFATAIGGFTALSFA
jgi:hypothetical protein